MLTNPTQSEVRRLEPTDFRTTDPKEIDVQDNLTSAMLDVLALADVRQRGDMTPEASTELRAIVNGIDGYDEARLLILLMAAVEIISINATVARAVYDGDSIASLRESLLSEDMA